MYLIFSFLLSSTTLIPSAISARSRMLFHAEALRERRADRDERGVPELHVPEQHAHVFPAGMSVREAARRRLHRNQEARGVLPRHRLPGGYVPAARHFGGARAGAYRPL